MSDILGRASRTNRTLSELSSGLRGNLEAESRQKESLLQPTEQVIEAIRRGAMVVIVDDETRENEGDLIIGARYATPEAIAFMALHGRGLICLALSPLMVGRLGLTMQQRRHRSVDGTAFTVSMDARVDVTTGISAADRAKTIAVAINPASGPNDIATPGHTFPLRAHPGGVLIRRGHTEAAVDLARLADLEPAGVICEIMHADGTMMRLAQLTNFAQNHALVISSVEELVKYRRRTEAIPVVVGIERLTRGSRGSHRGVDTNSTWIRLDMSDRVGGAITCTAWLQGNAFNAIAHLFNGADGLIDGEALSWPLPAVEKTILWALEHEDYPGKPDIVDKMINVDHLARHSLGGDRAGHDGGERPSLVVLCRAQEAGVCTPWDVRVANFLGLRRVQMVNKTSFPSPLPWVTVSGGFALEVVESLS